MLQKKLFEKFPNSFMIIIIVIEMSVNKNWINLKNAPPIKNKSS